jgi:hypothetical protein
MEAIDQWAAMLRNMLAKNYARRDEVLTGMGQRRTKEHKKRKKTMNKLTVKTEGSRQHPWREAGRQDPL